MHTPLLLSAKRTMLYTCICIYSVSQVSKNQFNLLTPSVLFYIKTRTQLSLDTNTNSVASRHQMVNSGQLVTNKQVRALLHLHSARHK